MHNHDSSLQDSTKTSAKRPIKVLKSFIDFDKLSTTYQSALECKAIRINPQTPKRWGYDIDVQGQCLVPTI